MHKEGANRYNMQKNFQESFYEFFQKENAGRDDMPVWQCYKRLDEIGRKKKILNNSLFETDDVGQLLQIKQIVVNSFFFRKRKLFIYAIDLYIQYISGIKNNKEPIEQINDRSEQKKMLPQKEEPEDIEIEQERSGGEESSRDRKESYEEERQDNGQEEDADEDISEKLKKVETGQALVEKTVNDEETNDIQERMTDKKGGAMIEKKNTWTEKDRELFAKYEQKYEQVRDALERMSESQKEGVPLFDLWMSFQYTIPYSNVKAIVNNASWAQKDCHSYYYKPIDKANDAVVIKKGPILWGQDAKGAKERSRSWRTGETRVDVAKNDAQAPAASKRDKEQEETESKKKAIQPKWDKYEAALLVEACLKVKGGVSRNEVVSELSQTLRRLAAVRGLQIDEVYRNTVGIHWQMLSMQYVLRGDIYKAKTASRIFIEVANLFKRNKNDFYLLLQEAHRLCGGEAEEKEQKTSSNPNALITEKILPRVEEEKKPSVGGGVIDFENAGHFAYTKPISVSYFGEIDANISSWRDVFKSVLRFLLDDYPRVIRSLADSSRCDYLARRVEALRRPLFIEDGIYAEGNQNATEIVRHIGRLLDFCYVDHENVTIRYVLPEEEEAPKETKFSKQAEPLGVVLSETDRRLYEIIKENYKSGFLAGAINYKKIKRYYEEKYSKELLLANEAIKASLDKTCLNVGEKYYAAASLMEDELKERVLAYIEEKIAVNGYVYYGNIMEQFGYELTTKIPEESLLKKYLEQELAQYIFLDDYIARDKSVKVDPIKEVEAVLWAAVYPLSVEGIKARLPHLTDEVVQKAIASDGNILTTNNKEKFLVDSMGLTDDDLQGLKKIITEALERHSYMFGNELLEGLRINCASLYDRIKDFGDRGIRNAVALKLKDSFTFNGNIICPIGEEIDNAEVFKSFAKSEKYFTLFSLIKLQEQIGVGNVYFDAVNEVAARINLTDYVPNEALSFDESAIDSVIEQFVPNAICSIRQASNFAVYPGTCYPWTEYLLESYVAKFSRKFKLYHIGYTEGQCVGAIVKKDSQINSFDDVVVEYLIKNDAIQTVADALDGLVQDGYIARKRYKGIDELLAVAKAKRKE